jgi:hypothetical protein
MTASGDVKGGAGENLYVVTIPGAGRSVIPRWFVARAGTLFGLADLAWLSGRAPMGPGGGDNLPG